MNEWLNKSPEVVQPASSISPSSLTPHVSVSSNETTLYDNNGSGFFSSNNRNITVGHSCCETNQQKGNAKKRWLRQAISEDQCDSPCGQSDSPTLSVSLAPPKKRKLPRESLSTEGSPPTTPTRNSPALVSSQVNNLFNYNFYVDLFIIFIFRLQ